MTQLHAAIRNANQQEVLEIISGVRWNLRTSLKHIFGRPFIDIKNWHGETPLHLVISEYSNKPDAYQNILNALLNARANTEIKNAEGYTVLQMAASKGLKNAVEALITAGAFVNPFDEPKSPLACAAEAGHMEVVQYLLSNNAQVNINFSNSRVENPLTPLQAAAKSGNIEIVEMFLRIRNIDVNSLTANVSWSSRSPLWYAMEYGLKNNDFTIAKLLLANGADPNLGRPQSLNGCLNVMVLNLHKRAHAQILIDELTANGLTIRMSRPSFIEDCLGNVVRYSEEKMQEIKDSYQTTGYLVTSDTSGFRVTKVYQSYKV